MMAFLDAELNYPAICASTIDLKCTWWMSKSRIRSVYSDHLCVCQSRTSLFTSPDVIDWRSDNAFNMFSKMGGLITAAFASFYHSDYITEQEASFSALSLNLSDQDFARKKNRHLHCPCRQLMSNIRVYTKLTFQCMVKRSTICRMNPTQCNS